MNPEHVARTMRATAHIEAAQLVWPQGRFTRRSFVHCVSTITGLHVSMDCQRDLVKAIGVAADGSGQRDDCHDLGDAMDILRSLRFHMPGRQWQVLDDMVAAKLRADTAPGHAAQADAALARPPPAVKPGHGAGRPRKQAERLKRENRSLKQVVCRLRGLVRRLRAELQAKIHEMCAKTSVLKTPKRERAARKATERGVVSLAGGYRMCVAAERRPRWSRCSGRSS